MMDVSRAAEIVQSPQRIEVEFQGMPIWIDEVDERSKTARVYPENNPEAKQTVPVEELQEKH